jgi:hypothetical protein
MNRLQHNNRDQALADLIIGLRSLVLSVARHAIENRGGTAVTDPVRFELHCTGIPLSEENACRQEIDKLFCSLHCSIVFDLCEPASNVSSS